MAMLVGVEDLSAHGLWPAYHDASKQTAGRTYPQFCDKASDAIGCTLIFIIEAPRARAPAPLRIILSLPDHSSIARECSSQMTASPMAVLLHKAAEPMSGRSREKHEVRLGRARPATTP
jgi:hypothetical protein